MILYVISPNNAYNLTQIDARVPIAFKIENQHFKHEGTTKPSLFSALKYVYQFVADYI